MFCDIIVPVPSYFENFALYECRIRKNEKVARQTITPSFSLPVFTLKKK
jgi:hypothetical protein